MPKQKAATPKIILTEYQKRWVEDKSRFKIGLFTRQGGKSFAGSLEPVLDCIARQSKWVFLSAGQRQSKELMDKAAMHTLAAKRIIDVQEEEFEIEDKKFKQLELNFPNGSRIVGLPANPLTARGHSANILLDEFAFHRNSRDIWRALYPTITRGYKIRILSTGQGKKNKFYELWSGNPKYSKHFVDIYKAVKEGLELKDEEGNPCTPADLREGLADEEGWAQEFECKFLDELTAWLTYDLIGQVESDQAELSPWWVEALIVKATKAHADYKRESDQTGKLSIEAQYLAWAKDLLRKADLAGELTLGYDVARRRHLSVIWLNKKEGRQITKAVIELHKTPFWIQKMVLFPILDLPYLMRGCIDETGIGMEMAESARDRFGAKVEGITFSSASKELLANIIKSGLEDRKCIIPVEQTIRDSLHSVKKYDTGTGHFRFDADTDEKTGHADHFWALALALHATNKPAADNEIITGQWMESANMLREM